MRSSLTCSLFLKKDTHWNKISHIMLRNAEKPSIEPDSTTPGKIHHGLSQSNVNSYCHQWGLSTMLPAPEAHLPGRLYPAGNGLYPAGKNLIHLSVTDDKCIVNISPPSSQSSGALAFLQSRGSSHVVVLVL